MRRVFVSALLASALYGPAWADPLAITPDAYAASQSVNAVAASDQGAAQSAAPAAVNVDRRRYAQAGGPNLGGGFIEFLFSGAAREPAVPRAYQPLPEYRAYPRAYQPPPPPGYQPDAAPQASVDSTEPPRGYAPSSQGDMAHPPVDPKYDRQVVDYKGDEKPGTIIIDTPNKFLFLVQDNGKAMRYGIGVGRPGFTWAGEKTITAKREWPDWRPPSDMLQRRPDLPRYMAGGPENPLGARAMYLGSTLYRIHGSNEPWTIGTNVSSGCIRLRNADVIDLFNRVPVGTKVVVM
jgi:lipoprotein-anchoring transpeptidase ErfK/SrfK